MYEPESPSFIVAATEKVLVPASQSDGSSTDQLNVIDSDTEHFMIPHNEAIIDEKQLVGMNEKDYDNSPVLVEDIAFTGEVLLVSLPDISEKSEAVRHITIPPSDPGTEYTRSIHF
ncbi:uncharacterized protein [Rutidosis leptorrhynchoides]|uniref:uncharacterized protein n=1 Tax=Rutidosis leptorrhynchoides TaxID=125765 RepID=UPI003A99CCEC